MPQLIGTIAVVTLEELVPAFFPSYGALKKRILRSKHLPGGIKRYQSGGNGRKMMVLYDTLPESIKSELLDPRLDNHILSNYYEIDADANDYYTEFRYPDGSWLKPESQQKYVVNASVMQAAINLHQDREDKRRSLGMSKGRLLQGIAQDVVTFNAVLKEEFGYEHSLPSHPRRFSQAFKQFVKDGYVSLIKDSAGNAKKNALKRTGDVEILLNNLFAGQNYKPTASEVARAYLAFLEGDYKVVNEATGELYDPSKFKSLSESTIRAYLSTWESTSGTHALRSGDRQKYLDAKIPYTSMEQPHFAGSMLSIDDRQPPFWYEKRSRMWWYLGIDLASEAIVAWAYGKTKEELILNFYRQLVRNCHEWNIPMPAALECESSLNSSFRNTFLAPGAMFDDVQIRPNSARSKRIERYFKEMRYSIEKEQEGWIARPHAKNESNQLGPDQLPVIPYQELVEQCFSNIEKWNNMPNSQNPDISRFEYFSHNYHPALKPTNYRAFMYHLGQKTGSSCKVGIIKLKGREWILGQDGEVATGEELIRLLKVVEGKSVDIYWLDDNKGQPFKAMVYDSEGRYICEVIEKPLAARAPIEETPAHRDAREVMSRYIQTVTSFIKLQKSKIERTSVIKERSATISDSFSIPGMEREVIEDDLEFSKELPELPDPLNPENNPGPAIRSWKDSFK
jgi:hypothetical protein